MLLTVTKKITKVGHGRVIWLTQVDHLMLWCQGWTSSWIRCFRPRKECGISQICEHKQENKKPISSKLKSLIEGGRQLHRITICYHRVTLSTHPEPLVYHFVTVVCLFPVFWTYSKGWSGSAKNDLAKRAYQKISRNLHTRWDLP